MSSRPRKKRKLSIYKLTNQTPLCLRLYYLIYFPFFLHTITPLWKLVSDPVYTVYFMYLLMS
jgi:hypothetical protein